MNNESTIFLDGKLIDTTTNTSNTTNILICKNKIIGLGYVPDEDEENLIQKNIKNSYIFPKPIAIPSTFDKIPLKLCPEKGLFESIENIETTTENIYPLTTLDKIQKSTSRSYGILLTPNSSIKDAISIAKIANVPLICNFTKENSSIIINALQDTKIRAHLLIEDLPTLYPILKTAKKNGLKITSSLCLNKLTLSNQIDIAIKEGLIDTISCPKGSEEKWFFSVLDRFKDKLDPIKLAEITSGCLHKLLKIPRWSIGLNNSANFLIIDLKKTYPNYLKYILVNGFVVN